MKANELIKKLEELILIYGNLDVEIPETDMCYYGHTEIRNIEIDNTDNNLVIELCG